MASTAAAARLLGLNEQEVAQAFNLAIAANVALYQTRIGEVSMWKGCGYANASRNAVFAATLAARGMTGPSPIFEGIGGYFKAVSRQPFDLPLLGGRGTPFKIMECSMKRFPLGQYSQTVVEAALQLRDKIGSPDDIAEVRIETVTTAIKIMAGDPEKWEPKTRESADHSMPYTVAVALMYGEVEEKHFGERYLNDSKLLALTRKVRADGSAEADARMIRSVRPRCSRCNSDRENHCHPFRSRSDRFGDTQRLHRFLEDDGECRGGRHGRRARRQTCGRLRLQFERTLRTGRTARGALHSARHGGSARVAAER